jgi:hypothetical protein
MSARRHVDTRRRAARINRENLPLHQGYCACGKLRYVTKADAKKRLKQAQKARRSGLSRAQPAPGKTPERSVYFCRLCDGWHLTSQEPRK